MGATSECSSCGSKIALGAKFCRHCGAAMEATRAEAPAAADPAEGKQGICPACSTPVPPGAAFCRSCGERQTEAAEGDFAPAQPPPPPTPPPPSRSPDASPPPPTGRRPATATPPPPSGNRGPLFALGAVAACLVLAGLVGGGAYLLTREDDSESPVSYGQPLTPWEEADSASPPLSSEEEEAAGSSDLPETPPPPSEFEEARETFRTHWQAIADGRYDEAYDQFHPGYEAERTGWIGTHETEATRVNTSSITVEAGATEPRGDEYWLYVEVPLRDGGGAYAGDCRLFYGEVRMARSAGELLYRPGVYRGREGSFGRADLGGGVRDLPESSPRCS